MRPDELSPDLTPDRLAAIGVAIAAGRNEARLERSERDDSWCLGSRAYTWIRGELTSLAKRVSWLRVIDGGLQFQAMVGSVPFRFCREDGDQLSLRHSRATRTERVKLQELFDFADVVQTLRFVYSLNGDGFVAEVILARVDESGDMSGRWVVWESSENSAPESFDLPEPMDLPPPRPELPDEDTGSATGTDDRTE